MTLLLVLAAVGCYSFGIYRTYYTKCVYPVSSDHTCVLPVYKNLDVVNPPAIELKNRTVVRQSIVPECGRIEALQFMAKVVDSSKDDKITLTVTDDQGNQIAKTDLSIYGVEAGRFISIPIELTNVENKTIWLDLSSDQSNSSTSQVDLFYRPNAAVYPQGELFMDGSREDADLVFQYTCVFK